MEGFMNSIGLRLNLHRQGGDLKYGLSNSK